MSHHCKGALITCEDFRLHQRTNGRNYIAELIKTFGFDCDLITRGGSVQDIVRPSEAGFKETIIRDLNVSAKLHDADVICLVNHADCGAYASQFKFNSSEEEFAQHKKDLEAAADILKGEYPGKTFRLFYFKLKAGTSDKFTVEEIK